MSTKIDSVLSDVLHSISQLESIIDDAIHIQEKDGIRFINDFDFSKVEFINCNFDNAKFNKDNSFMRTDFKEAKFFLTEFKE